jgi:two-component system nitrogen regulation response regulator GlnG
MAHTDVSKGSRARLVLIVEDDKPTCDVLETAINEERGYTAVCAGTADDALETLSRMAPDLMVLDIRLPGMSGLELYDRIKADPRFRSLPVVFETANVREHIDDLRERGIATYVKKPFDIDEVVRFVKRLVPPLNGHARRSPS